MAFNLFSGDPQSQAMLALTSGLLESAGPSRMPVGLGQGVARGMLAGREAFEQARQMEMKQKFFDLQMQQQQQAQMEAQRKKDALGKLAADPRFAPFANLLAVDPSAAIKAVYPEAKVVAPGGALVNPSAPQTPLFQSPEKPPASVQEYEFAKKQGYKGSFQDFVVEQKMAGANRQITNVNSFMPASEEAQKEQMKSIRVNYEALRNAPATLKNIEEAKALIPAAKGFMGTGGETLLEAAKFLNNRLGTNIDTQGVKSAEELRTRVFFQIMENLKKMDAQPSQMQQVMMRDALGKLGTDPNALGAVLDAYGDVIRDKVAVHNREVEGSKQSGVRFPFNPTIDLGNFGASKPTNAKETFTSLPPANAHKGKTIKSSDGKLYKSDGMKWVPQ